MAFYFDAQWREWEVGNTTHSAGGLVEECFATFAGSSICANDAIEAMSRNFGLYFATMERCAAGLLGISETLPQIFLNCGQNLPN